MGRRRRPDLVLVLLLVLCGGLAAALAPLLQVQNLVADYPLMGGDSQDWIANGLALAGAEVHYSVRPPALPLVIAALDRLAALEVLPVLLLCLQLGASVVLYLYLRRRAPPSLALAVSVGMAGCFSWLGLGVQVMADVPAACLLFAGSVCFIAAAEQDPHWFLPAGLLLGLSAVTQPVALLFALPATAALVIHRRDLTRARSLWIGAFLFAAPTGVWLSYKLVAFGTAGDVRMRHWSLLGPHLGGVAFSTMSGLSMLGVVGGGLAAAGLVLLARRARSGFAETVVVGLVIVVAVFFVFGYRFHAKRLLVYLVPFSAVSIAEALTRLRRPFPRWVVTLLFVACAWMPLPGGPSSEATAAIWPLPPVFLHTTTTGGLVPPSVAAPRITSASLSEVASWSLFGQLMEQRDRGSHSRPPDPRRFAADRAAVWIHDGAVAAEDRYVSGLRMGNLLRKRVTHVSLPEVRPLGRWLRSRFVTDVEGLRLYRAELSGLDGTWLLIVARETGADSWAAHRLRAPSDGPVPGLGVARRIVLRAGGRPTVVVADHDAGPSLPLLPFLSRSDELYLMDSAAFAAAARAFRAVRRARLDVIDGATLWDLDVTGRPFLLVDYTSRGR